MPMQQTNAAPPKRFKMTVDGKSPVASDKRTDRRTENRAPKSWMRLLPWLLTLCVAASGAYAQSWPAKPIRIVVPSAPGGLADNTTRVIAERLAARLGQPVVVENRPGAHGNIGTAEVAQSAPDGHTLLLALEGNLVINPHLYPKPGFDTLRDFAPITKLGEAGIIMVAHPSLPAKDLREVIALAKAKPGSLSYGTSGTGSGAHLACELLSQRAGIELLHVPYKGGGQAMTDLVGGQIPLGCTAIATAQQFVKSGRLKGIAVSSAMRSPALPDVPTFAESDLPGFVVNSWVGVLAPAKTPRPIIERLQKEINAVLNIPEVKERYKVLGIETVGNAPEEYAAQIRTDLARWEIVIRKARIKVE
ncbi:MAG: LacI family transcriptional regulator [Herminiimonas sp.]|nr:LacI family transcriptional regulator [Herminiimonas sp.]